LQVLDGQNVDATYAKARAAAGPATQAAAPRVCEAKEPPVATRSSGRLRGMDAAFIDDELQDGSVVIRTVRVP
jgi:hypothetical protein